MYALSTGTFDWWVRFTRWAAETGQSVTVADLRARLVPFGMGTEVEDLLILAWAALADRQWMRHGSPMPAPGVGSLGADVTLRPAVLPAPDTFDAAVARGETLFGLKRELYCNTASVGRLSGALHARAIEVRGPVGDLVAELEKHQSTLGLDVTAGRLATAHRARDLVEALVHETDPTALLETFALFDLPDEPQPLARSISSAHAVVAALRGATWDLLDQLSSVDGDDAVRQSLHEAARAEELHQPLAPALSTARQGLVELLKASKPPKDPSTKTPGAEHPPTTDEETVNHPDAVTLDIDDLDDVVSQLRAAHATKVPGKKLRVRWWWE